MKNRIISSVSPLQPTEVWDVKTGENVADWATPITALLEYVRSEAEHIYTDNPGEVERVCGESRRVKPAEWARQNGIKLLTRPPVMVKVQSRVEKLVQEKLISEVSSYVANPNPLKKKPSFYPKVNLGAVDKQMASLSSSEPLELSLLWKVWDRELLLVFKLPSYLLKRDIKKWCLPSVLISRKTGEPVFYYSYEETPKPGKHSKSTAGIDLGRAEPFTLAIINQAGEREAHYTSSGMLRKAQTKRERLLQERKEILAKLSQYKALKYNPVKQETLKQEADYVRDKIRRLGVHISHQVSHEVAARLAKHEVSLVKLEDLSWVKGKQYGGRWNHAHQQEAITHALAREGIRTEKVNPKNTSQECHKCGTLLTHNSKKRSVHCPDCQQSFDRDFNAAMNIAARSKTLYPASKREAGDSYSSTAEQTVSSPSRAVEVVLRKTT